MCMICLKGQWHRNYFVLDPISIHNSTKFLEFLISWSKFEKCAIAYHLKLRNGYLKLRNGYLKSRNAYSKSGNEYLIRKNRRGDRAFANFDLGKGAKSRILKTSEYV